MAKRTRSGKICVCVLNSALCIAGLMQPAMATKLEASLGLDNRFSDNVRKADANEESDVETRVNVTVGAVSEPGRCSGNFNAGLGYGFWHSGSFDPELYTDGKLDGACSITPALQWQVSDRISQVRQNNQAPDTPDNRTRKNTFSTGPVYSFQLTDVDVVQLTAAYKNTEFEEPEEADSESASVGLSYNHRFSSTFQGGVSLSAERTELDTEEEVDTEAASLTFNKIWAATSLSGAIGGNRLETRLGSSEVSTDGVFADIRLNRSITQSSQISLAANRRLTDRTSTIGIAFEDFSFNLRDTSAVEVTALTVDYRNTLSSGSALIAQLESSRSDYIESGNREEMQKASARYSHPISGVSSLSTQVSHRRSSFGDGSDDEVTSASVGYSHQLSKSLQTESSVGHSQKRSEVSSREYDENWILLSLKYSFK